MGINPAATDILLSVSAGHQQPQRSLTIQLKYRYKFAHQCDNLGEGEHLWDLFIELAYSHHFDRYADNCRFTTPNQHTFFEAHDIFDTTANHLTGHTMVWDT